MGDKAKFAIRPSVALSTPSIQVHLFSIFCRPFPAPIVISFLLG